MDRSAITADVVHDALRAVRYGKPLDESPLLHLGALRARLRAAGHDDTPESRSAELAVHLADVVHDRLAALRGTPSDLGGSQPTPKDELKALDDDFAAGSVDREAWSMLYARFLANAPLQVRQISARTGVAQRTLTRRTERGYSLLAEELKRRELVEAPVAQHNIPYPLTRFIGRESEIGEVRRLLAQHRLMTLTGVGGIGKSRLATEVARTVAGDYADGAWMVELGSIEDGAQVVAAVAAVFDVKEQPRRELAEVLSDFFEAKHLLLIVDNCEHLTEACGDLVQTLLGQCQDLQILATSRERLRIQGECVWTVPPLSVPAHDANEPPRPSAIAHFDSVRLFTDRAALALPGFKLTAESAPHVAVVCTMLDGVPLATELAASRVKMLTPNELVLRLSAPLDVLKDGRQPTRPQHETLRSTMDWSYHLLDEEEQVLFRRLSVFRGGWMLGVAEAVCAGDGFDKRHVIDVLQRLVDKSLVEARGSGGVRRYRMLKPVQQYAEERLGDSGELGVARDRHLAACIAIAEEAWPELDGPAQVEWFSRLDAERANMRAALRWSQQANNALSALRLGSALGRFWRRRGHFAEGRLALANALSSDGTSKHMRERAKALREIGRMAGGQADYAQSQAYLEESVSICRREGDGTGLAHSLSSLGWTKSSHGDLEAARALCVESRELAIELGLEVFVSHVDLNLASIAASIGNLAEAQKFYEEALAIALQRGDEGRLADIAAGLGDLANHRGDYETARLRLEEALATERRLGKTFSVGHTVTNLGVSNALMGNLTEARARFTEGLAIFRHLGAKSDIAIVLHNLGETALIERDFEEAQRYYDEGLAIRREIGDIRGIAASLESLGVLAKLTGDCEGSVEYLCESLALCRESGELRLMLIGLEARAAVAIVVGHKSLGTRLIGAADCARQQIGLAPEPTQSESIEESCRAARAALGDTHYEAAITEGRALTLDEAVAYALGEVTWEELAPVVAERLAADEGAEALADEDATKAADKPDPSDSAVAT